MVPESASGVPVDPSHFSVHRSGRPLRGGRTGAPDNQSLRKEGLGTTTTPATMASIITEVSALVTAAVGWIGDYVGAITSNPLLLMFVVIAFVGLGVGLIRRIISL